MRLGAPGQLPTKAFARSHAIAIDALPFDVAPSRGGLAENVIGLLNAALGFQCAEKIASRNRCYPLGQRPHE
ncbi:MAG TPA: hypothetical protein VJ770_27480 [Stellaceae bacterium]|nr:hypothetical protein [Stellaceae bacterium]